MPLANHVGVGWDVAALLGLAHGYAFTTTYPKPHDEPSSRDCAHPSGTTPGTAPGTALLPGAVVVARSGLRPPCGPGRSGVQSANLDYGLKRTCIVRLFSTLVHRLTPPTMHTVKLLAHGDITLVSPSGPAGYICTGQLDIRLPLSGKIWSLPLLTTLSDWGVPIHYFLARAYVCTYPHIVQYISMPELTLPLPLLLSRGTFHCTVTSQSQSVTENSDNWPAFSPPVRQRVTQSQAQRRVVGPVPLALPSRHVTSNHRPKRPTSTVNLEVSQ